MDHLRIGLAYELWHTVRAPCDAQPTANTPFPIHDGHSAFIGNRVHLTSLDADSTSHTLFRIDDGVVVGGGYRVLYAVVSDPPEDSATAAATVADIANPFHHVVHRVYQANFFSLVEDRQCLLPGNIFGPGRTLTGGEGKADPHRKITATGTQFILLHSADAVADAERIGRHENRLYIVVRQYPLGLHRILCGDNAMQSRLRPHDTLGPSISHVVLNQMSQLVVHEFQLRLVDTNHEGGQSEERLPATLVEPHNSTPDQLHQPISGLLGIQPGSLGDHVDGFHSAGQTTCDRGLLRREDLLQ